MASKTYVLNLGSDSAGLTDLRAQFRTSAGAADGAAISAGFTAIGSGVYQWTGTIATDYQGSLEFYSAADATTIFLAFAINGGSATAPAASGDPATVTAYLYYYINGTPTAGATLYWQQLADAANTFEDNIESDETDSNGYVEFEAVIGGTYKVWLNNGRFKTITIAASPDPLELPDLVA